jgi:hypothetical protein
MYIKKNKVLFLQPRKYFEELGVNFGAIECTFGLIVSFNLAKSIKRFDLVVSCIDHDFGSRHLVSVANYHGVPTVFLMDGVYDNANAIHNPLTKQLGLKLLDPCIYKNLFVLGSYFKEYIEENYDVRCFEYFPRRAVLELNNIVPKAGVLLSSAMTPYFNEIEFVELVHWYKQLLNVISLSGIKYFSRIYDEKLLNAIPQFKLVNNIDETLSEAFSRAEALICTPSTLIYSAARYGIPTATLNYRCDKLYFNCDYDVKKACDIDIDFINNLTAYVPSYNNDIYNELDFNNYDYHTTNDDSLKKVKSLYVDFSFFSRMTYKVLPKNIKAILKKIHFTLHCD